MLWGAQMDISEILRIAPVAQVVSYVALTIASVTVAAVQLTIAYRQNFGWRPLLVITNATHSEGQPHMLELSYEIWNRRRYPILLRSVQVRIQWRSIIEDKKGREIAFSPLPTDKLLDTVSATLDPTSHKGFCLSRPIRGGTSGYRVGLVMLDFVYFDPRLGREVQARHARAYSMKPDS